MDDLNLYVFTGRIVKDPEMRGQTGAVTTFSVASNRNQKKNADGTWSGDTDWNNCIVFGACDLKKGDSVQITGKLQDNNYIDKQGAKQTRKKVVVDSWKVFKKRGESKPRGNGLPVDEDMNPQPDDNEIPF